MKTCPICHAHAFDDAKICYGCMYRFGGASATKQIAADETEWEPEEANFKHRARHADLIPVQAGQQEYRAKRSQDDEGVPSEENNRDALRVSHARGSVRASPGAEQNISGAGQGVQEITPPSVQSCTAGQDQRAHQDLFDAAGWVVRFELPGGSVPFGAAPSSGQTPIFEAGQSLLGEGRVEVSETHACPLVISISPAPRTIGNNGAQAVSHKETEGPKDSPERHRAQVAS